MQDTEALLCAMLRGENPAWPVAGDADLTAGFLERSLYHGVQPLFHYLVKSEQVAAQGWPQAVLEECHWQAIAWTMWELRHQVLLKQVLELLAGMGVQPVLFKGTALAYSLYPGPALRSRGDTDLIVSMVDRVRVAEALEGLGFTREAGVSGAFISYQATFTLTEASGSSHSLDLHWRINNSQLLARLFSYEELRSRAQALPELSPHAFAASPVDALLLACMHRSGHKQSPYYVDGVAHYSGDRLIWIYDIHLLARKLTQDEWTEFMSLATQKGLRAVCLEGLALAQTCFSTPIESAVIEGLARHGHPEPIAQYMESSAVRRRWLDFCAIDGWRGKRGFLTEYLFPPAGYMLQKYQDTGSTWLPWLYVRRMKDGLSKRLQDNGE
jgi:hypothetical protein